MLGMVAGIDPDVPIPPEPAEPAEEEPAPAVTVAVIYVIYRRMTWSARATAEERLARARAFRRAEATDVR